MLFTESFHTVGPEPNEIIPGLFLSSEKTAKNKEVLQSMGFTHVVVVGHELCTPFEKDFTYLKIPVEDTLKEDLLHSFKETYDFIENALETEGGRVLVHCAAGVSRSATITISYLMRKNKLRVEKAYEFVKEKRPCVNPNRSFRRQLGIYEKMLVSCEHESAHLTPRSSPLTLIPSPSLLFLYQAERYAKQVLRASYHGFLYGLDPNLFLSQDLLEKFIQFGMESKDNEIARYLTGYFQRNREVSFQLYTCQFCSRVLFSELNLLGQVEEKLVVENLLYRDVRWELNGPFFCPNLECDSRERSPVLSKLRLGERPPPTKGKSLGTGRKLGIWNCAEVVEFESDKVQRVVCRVHKKNDGDEEGLARSSCELSVRMMVVERVCT